jgi:hypothetical protein
MTVGTYSEITGLVDPSPVTGVCAFCGKIIVGKIDRVESKAACDGCAAAAAVDFLEDRVLLTRGFFLGGIAALVYFLLLACLDVVLDGVRVPSFMALPVGWIVARSFALGSRGAPGLKFRLTPVIVSYLAMSLAAIPVLLLHVVDAARASGDWAVYAFLAIPLRALTSPLWVDKTNQLMSMVNFLFLAAGLGVAWKESVVVSRPKVIR